ncbi:MAG: diguanylate cyclase, partial [Acidobacteria bacterium]|nr:diguanylate cyclase [Acidobacteriota bacterium]
MTTDERLLPESKATSEELADRILVAEDDPMFRKILQSWLESWGYQVISAEDGARAWGILEQEKPPELLILDWVMPAIDGIELCRRIREQQRQPQPYILLVTAKDDSQDVVRGLDAGADDYLTKPFDNNEFRARLRVGQRTLDLQTSLIKAREELQFQATHDLLTGIWNRSALLDLFNRELERSTRAAISTAVLMLDVDHFKRINDTHGHLTGDVVLKEIAHRIGRVVRIYDLVGRYGGEEFLAVLPNCNREQVVHSAERIRSVIENGPIVIPGSELHVTVSIG